MQKKNKIIIYERIIDVLNPTYNLLVSIFLKLDNIFKNVKSKLGKDEDNILQLLMNKIADLLALHYNVIKYFIIKYHAFKQENH